MVCTEHYFIISDSQESLEKAKRLTSQVTNFFPKIKSEIYSFLKMFFFFRKKSRSFKF